MRRAVFILALGLLSQTSHAGVPHLPEIREFLSPIQVKVNAGHYQDLRLGQEVAVVRETMVLAYARVSSIGEDWAVLDISRQRPDSVLSTGDQILSLTAISEFPLGLRRPLVEKSEPVNLNLARLFATDVDHGLETDPPRLTYEWHHPVPEVSQWGRPQKAEVLLDRDTHRVAPTPGINTEGSPATWVFELKQTSISSLQQAVGDLGYGQRILIRPHDSAFPEDQGKLLVKVATTGTDLLSLVAKVIQDLEKPVGP